MTRFEFFEWVEGRNVWSERLPYAQEAFTTRFTKHKVTQQRRYLAESIQKRRPWTDKVSRHRLRCTTASRRSQRNRNSPASIANISTGFIQSHNAAVSENEQRQHGKRQGLAELLSLPRHRLTRKSSQTTAHTTNVTPPKPKPVTDHALSPFIGHLHHPPVHIRPASGRVI